ncbi:Fanconi anemia group F protein [Lampris incognitus]|uniref:Fanconi anemia group F protein n=1 Tax=Lampris incognitus TaxID=2546036 RepID=UPI0024B510FA|nr:Fanconi anemia group F protein [Lampris incognitus]
MEAVLRNLESAAELLAVTRTDVVGRWDEKAVDGAFRWARYCEHLHSRFHTNSPIRKRLENQLLVANQRLRAAFPGYAEVTFSDLGRSQHLLLERLLANRVLPSSILRVLLCSPVYLKTDDNEVREGATGDCIRLVEYKSACKVLGAVNVGPPSFPGPEVGVQATMLTERLGALLQGGEVEVAERFLNSLLDAFEDKGCVCLIVAAGLVTRESSVAAEDASVDFLLNWLLQNSSLLQYMCYALPAGLLRDLVKQNVKFGVAYCNILRNWASDMEYDLSEGKWIHTSPGTRMSFEELSDRFLALFEASSVLREDIEKKLNALKISDGDFDVRGLSVWGDLLSEMKRKCKMD